MNKLLLILSFVFLCSSCQKQEIKRIYIADRTVDCDGVAPQQCMLLKDVQSQDWTYFYDTIEGFDYEEGFTYELEVAVNTIEKPLADSSSTQYSLIKIISKNQNSAISQNIVLKNQESQENVSSIVYEASTRGSFLHIKVDKNTIQKTTDRSLENVTEKRCSKDDWATILSFLENIQLKNIDDLIAPTQKSSVDAALQAKLKITAMGNTYSSTNFDHGNPPQEIKQLVNTILSLSESIE